MRAKAKKTKKEIKIRDLKPVKNAKGGFPGRSSRGISTGYLKLA